MAVIEPPKYQRKSGKKEKPTNGGGADFSPDGHTLYWSSGETGAIYLLDTRFHQQISEVSLNTEIGGRKYEDSYVVDVKVSGDGKYLYCADVTNFRIVVIDIRWRFRETKFTRRTSVCSSTVPYRLPLMAAQISGA